MTRQWEIMGRESDYDRLEKRNNELVAVLEEAKAALEMGPCHAPMFIRETGGCEKECARCWMIAEIERVLG